MTRKPTLYTDEGEKELPFMWAICDDCEGHGRSSAYLGAFTGEQMQEDPDFAEEYMNGYYDRTCEACDGSGKVAVVDAKACNRADLKAYRAQQQEEAEQRAYERSERYYEGGWREEGWY